MQVYYNTYILLIIMGVESRLVNAGIEAIIWLNSYNNYRWNEYLN